jgi:hypothetical protein
MKQIIKKIVGQILSQPLIERRDYGVKGYDILEKDALDLKEEGKLPKDIEEQMKKRLKNKS